MGTVKVHTQHSNMNALVILAVVGYACGAPQHHHVGIADTPEVAAAKARFFQTYNTQAAAARAASPQQATVLHQQPRWTGPMAHTVPAGVNVHHAAAHVPHYHVAGSVTQKWTGPLAATVPAGVQGVNQVPDTADVQAATRSFLAAYQAQLAATASRAPAVAVHHAAAPVQTWAPAAPVQPRWTGPMAATIPAGVHGAPVQVAQSADVALATQAHFAAHQHALRATG